MILDDKGKHGEVTGGYGVILGETDEA